MLTGASTLSNTTSSSGSNLTTKFYPPAFDEQRHLLRKRLLFGLPTDSKSGGKTLTIEGQAGQGKSQLAIQFLHHFKRPFTWIQLGTEEADPILLLMVLLEGLRRSLPEFSCEELENWLSQGTATPEDGRSFVEILARDLEGWLTDDFYLVLDDLHLLENHTKSLELIAAMLKAERSRFNLILISRLPILPALKMESHSLPVHKLSNEHLSLNRQEIAELFNLYFKIPITPAEVNNLYEHNEGWIMGLVLAVQGFSSGSLDAGLSPVVNPHKQENFQDYFSTEVLHRLPEGLGEDLLRLSLLDEIPADLAIHLTGKPTIVEQLLELEDKNFFVRSLDQARTVFSLHHLLRESLRQVALTQKGSETVCETWNCAGRWYRDAIPEKALSYLLRAGNYRDSQSLLATVGMQLLASNRLVTLRDFLAQVPQEALRNHPWLAFYQGVVRINFAPPEALGFLEEARLGFIQEKNELGELAALIQIIFFHTAIDCRFQHGQSLLERGIQLYQRHHHSMEESQQAHAANVIALGLTFFSAELERARSFADLGLQISQQSKLKNLEAEARLVRCYRDIFVGALKNCRLELDLSLCLLDDPQVSQINKGALHLSQLNLLANEGDAEGYESQRQYYLDKYGSELINQSSYGAIMRVWEIDLALAHGDEIKAGEILDIALASQFGSSLAHMRSFYLHYQAHLLARQQRTEEALQSLEESRALRDQAGGRYFIAVNKLLLGGALVNLGHFEDAEKMLHEGLEISRKADELFLRPGFHGYLAWSRLKQARVEDVGEHLSAMFGCFQETGFRTFYGWDPKMAAELLTFAVRQKIHVDLAKEIGANRLGRAFATDGSSWPLVRIFSLGSLEISSGTIKLANAELSPSMRQLLAMLITAPGHQLDQHIVQNSLWPDESPTRGRARFDTLISRTRKLFNQRFPAVDVKEFLLLQRGVLKFGNCWIDIDEFQRLIKSGLLHIRRRQQWQAGNVLRRGLSLWRGEFLDGQISQVDLGRASGDLLSLFLEASSQYAEIAASMGRVTEAIVVLQVGLRYDPIHETLARQLYDLLTSLGKPHRAQQVFHDYKDALKKEGCSADDIELLLEEFWR